MISLFSIVFIFIFQNNIMSTIIKIRVAFTLLRQVWPEYSLKWKIGTTSMSFLRLLPIKIKGKKLMLWERSPKSSKLCMIKKCNRV